MSFFTKYKLQIDIAAVIAFGLSAADKAWRYSREDEKKEIRLLGIIIFSIMMIFKLVDVIESYKSKRKTEKISTTTIE